MHIVVLVVGLLAAAAGLTAIVFGISIKEFTFGSTLLITGTTMLVGGLVMIAVAGAVRELSRIARALNRPAPVPRFPRPGEPFDPYAPGSVRPRMSAPRPPAAQMPEAKPEVAVPAETAAPAEAPALIPDNQMIPLSPHEAPRGPDSEAVDETPEPVAAPEAEETQPKPQDAASEPASEDEPVPQGGAPSNRGRPSPFDAIWPRHERPSARRLTEGEAEDAAPRHDEEADSAPEATTPPPGPVAGRDAFWRPEEAAAEPKVADTEEDDRSGEAPYAVSILKSGVVDGMAYTLYSDGSIEAELPSGTLRFASITELRMHLEQTE